MRRLLSTVDPTEARGKGGIGVDWVRRRRFQLNGPVSRPEPSVTTYRLAPALGVRLVGRALVTLAVLVFVVALVSGLSGAGWAPAGGVTLVGLLLAGVWAWYLLRRAWVVRLTARGYAVRLLGGIGASDASWSEVEEAVAASRGDARYLVLRLRDGRSTRLAMAALAGDADLFASDVQARVRDAHTPGDPGAP
jgi:hypothetical protein